MESHGLCVSDMVSLDESRLRTNPATLVCAPRSDKQRPISILYLKHEGEVLLAAKLLAKQTVND